MKKFSLIITLIILLVLTPQVKANEAVITETYAADSKWVVPSALQCFDKASGYYSVTTSFTTNTTEIDGVKGKDYYTCNIGSSGVIAFNLDEITSSNKLYSLALYISNYNNIAPTNSTAIGLGTSTYTANNDIYYSTNNGTLWSSRVNGPFNIYQPTTSSLNTIKYYVVYVLFSSKSNSTSLAVKIDYASSAANNYIWGYNLECLGDATGLTASDVEDIVSNSGLATASSVEEVEQSVAEVKEEITELNEQQQITNEKLDNIDGTLNNSDSSEATDSAGDFFSGFQTDTFGLTSVITAPLELIGSITSSSCSPLALEVPFVNKSLNLPCLTTIYKNFFGDFLTVYQTITFGIVAYWVCIRIFALVKDFKNPDHDEIEVLDL